MPPVRFASLLLLGLGSFVTGCSVPDVTFATDGAVHDVVAPLEAGLDAPASTDSDADAAADSASDVPGEAEPAYCVGPDGGTPPPNGLACCPGGMGEACAGECMAKACKACGNCIWPSVCCTNGANGTCKPYC